MRLPLWASATSRRSERQTGLGVLPGATSRWSSSARGRPPSRPQRAQLLLVEDLRDEAEVAHGHDVAALAVAIPGGLLAAVLERVQREVGEAATSDSGA